MSMKQPWNVAEPQWKKNTNNKQPWKHQNAKIFFAGFAFKAFRMQYILPDPLRKKGKAQAETRRDISAELHLRIDDERCCFTPLSSNAKSEALYLLQPIFFPVSRIKFWLQKESERARLDLFGPNLLESWKGTTFFWAVNPPLQTQYLSWFRVRTEKFVLGSLTRFYLDVAACKNCPGNEVIWHTHD